MGVKGQGREAARRLGCGYRPWGQSREMSELSTFSPPSVYFLLKGKVSMQGFRAMPYTTASQLLPSTHPPGAGERTQMLFPAAIGRRREGNPDSQILHTLRNSPPLLPLISGYPKHLNMGSRTEDAPNPERFQTRLGSEGRLWGPQDKGIEVGKEGICQTRVMI